jgi:hypothetical protein
MVRNDSAKPQTGALGRISSGRPLSIRAIRFDRLSPTVPLQVVISGKLYTSHGRLGRLPQTGTAPTLVASNCAALWVLLFSPHETTHLLTACVYGGPPYLAGPHRS